MSPAQIVWSAFLFGVVVGGLVTAVVLACVVAWREQDEWQFTAEDLARMVERAK